LRFAQADIKLNGWAVESRLYAEDPYRSFLPSIGRLSRYRPPVEGTRDDGTVVRNDTGVFEGGEISMYYDPMIAKLCTWAPNRLAAIDAMCYALDDFEVEGIGHNLPFLSAVMDHPRFREGALTTAFIAEEYPDGFAGVPVSEDDARALAAVAAQINLAIERRNAQISGRISSEQQAVATDWVATLGGFTLPVRIAEGEGGTTINFMDGGSLPIASDWHPGSQLGSFTVAGKPIAVKVSRAGTGWRLRWRGMDVVAHIRKPRIAELAKLMPVKLPPDTSKMLLCPMPGVITSILVKDG